MNWEIRVVLTFTDKNGRRCKIAAEGVSGNAFEELAVAPKGLFVW